MERLRLTSLTVRGFKSLEKLEDFALRDVNVLIGANGAGKSNLVDFFRLLRAIGQAQLQSFVSDQGGGDSLLFLGPKRTSKLIARIAFSDMIYEFCLKATAASALMFTSESVEGLPGWPAARTFPSGHLESKLVDFKNHKPGRSGDPPNTGPIVRALTHLRIHHFNDSSKLANARRQHSIRDYEYLRDDASNLAAILLRLRQKHSDHYERIRDTVRLVAPFFDDFLLRPEETGGEEKVGLEWRQKGSDYPFQPSQLSDGTLRFISLVTALSQSDPPSIIVIDEPELGLHPDAISLLADMVRAESTRTQFIVSTQSPTFVDQFDVADIIVVRREEAHSVFERLDHAALKKWLKDYTIGELWQKNVVRGGPAHE
ncbi:MAG: AAA family ATPase [Phycisphaerae bacterium]